MSTNRFSRGTDQLTISDSQFRVAVSARFEHLKNPVGFPTVPNRITNRSESLGRYELSPKRRTFLKSKGYELSRESDNRWMMDRGRTRWWIKRGLDFVVYWHESEIGATLRLETEPLGGGGNHVEATELAQHFREYGVKLHPLVCELIDNNGLLSFSWDELGIESSMTIVNLWKEFVAAHEELAQKFLMLLARTEELKSFDPNPYYWSSRPDRMLLESNARVPSSTQERLRSRWSKQKAVVASHFSR